MSEASVRAENREIAFALMEESLTELAKALQNLGQLVEASQKALAELRRQVRAEWREEIQ